MNSAKESDPLLLLEEAERESLSRALISKKFSKGQAIISQDQEDQYLLIIKSGHVKVSTVSDQGKELVLSILGQGQMLGEIALLTNTLRSADVIALSNCELFLLSKADFLHHCKSHSGLLRVIATTLAERLKQASERTREFVYLDLRTRLLQSLIRLGRRSELEGCPVAVLDARPTHKDLASLVGSSREVVTRALKELEEDGCILLEGKQLTVFL